MQAAQGQNMSSHIILIRRSFQSLGEEVRPQISQIHADFGKGRQGRGS
jgi:hypothetical protein